jgi:hypothetical protein
MKKNGQRLFRSTALANIALSATVLAKSSSAEQSRPSGTSGAFPRKATARLEGDGRLASSHEAAVRQSSSRDFVSQPLIIASRDGLAIKGCHNKTPRALPFVASRPFPPFLFPFPGSVPFPCGLFSSPYPAIPALSLRTLLSTRGLFSVPPPLLFPAASSLPFPWTWPTTPSPIRLAFPFPTRSLSTFP